MKTIKITENAHWTITSEKIELSRAGAKGIKTISDTIEFIYFYMHGHYKWNEETETQLDGAIREWNRIYDISKK